MHRIFYAAAIYRLKPKTGARVFVLRQEGEDVVVTKDNPTLYVQERLDYSACGWEVTLPATYATQASR